MIIFRLIKFIRFRMFLSTYLFKTFIISFINFIMTSQANTFRLQRLTKTVGIRQATQSQYQPKQTFKLAAINSITRGVKYNDLSYMTGRDLNKLRKQPEAGEDILYESAHTNLQGVRKNYDSVHKQKNIRDLSISKLKQQKNKLEINQKELKDKKQIGNNQVKILSQELEKIKLLFSETDMQKKVLQNLRARLKSDKVVYDQRKFDMEKQLRFLRKQKEVIIIDKNDVTQSDDRSLKVYKKLINQQRAEQEQREEHIRSLQSMIQQRQRVNQLNEFRGREMQEIAERAMQDKDDSEKNWMKLYLTNRLVSRLLRNKMDKQMNKFFLVESAFKTIKIATGVSDAETLVQKFLNKESAYGDLLGKIAQNEKKILVLKQEGEHFRKQQKQLETEKQIIESTKKASQNIEKQLKTLGEVDHKEEKSLIYRQKMRTWIGKTNKKLNSILGKQYPTHIDRNLKSISAAFINFLKNLSAELEIAKQKEIKEELDLNMQNKTFKKMVRVELQKEQEEQEQTTANNDQTDLIMAQRLEIIKTNQKQMKEIRKKFQEKKKIYAESSSPKKKPEGEKAPIKKPEDDA